VGCEGGGWAEGTGVSMADMELSKLRVANKVLRDSLKEFQDRAKAAEKAQKVAEARADAAESKLRVLQGEPA